MWKLVKEKNKEKEIERRWKTGRRSLKKGKGKRSEGRSIRCRN